MTQRNLGLAAQAIALDDRLPDDVTFEDVADDDGERDAPGSGEDFGGAAALTGGLIKRRRLTAVDPGGATDLIAYWCALRRGEAFPAPAELDAHHVARCWTGSVLMRITGGSPILVRRYGPNAVAKDAGVVATMQIQWIQGLTREVVAAGCPLQDKTTFPAGTLGVDEIQCNGIGVPLKSEGAPGSAADHVLCWVQAEI